LLRVPGMWTKYCKTANVAIVCKVLQIVFIVTTPEIDLKICNSRESVRVGGGNVRAILRCGCSSVCHKVEKI
jgi:hypothetical protein